LIFSLGSCFPTGHGLRGTKHGMTGVLWARYCVCYLNLSKPSARLVVCYSSCRWQCRYHWRRPWRGIHDENDGVLWLQLDKGKFDKCPHCCQAL